MKFDIVDLSDEPIEPADHARGPASDQRAPTAGPTAQDGGRLLGEVDTSTVAAGLEALRSDLVAEVKEEKDDGLRIEEVTVKLTLSAEGKVAFIAKGSAEACIEVKFKRKQ